MRSESGPVFELATRRLRTFAVADIWPVVRQMAEGEHGPVKDALDAILSGVPGVGAG